MATLKYFNTIDMLITQTTPIVQVTDATDTIKKFFYAGDPNGNLTADKGSQVNDTTNGVVWVKTTDASNTGWVQLTAGINPSLSEGTRSATNVDVDITGGGTSATLSPATITLAGVMLASDKQKLDYITITQAVDLDVMETDISNHQVLFGRPQGSVDLGTFTGSTIGDNLDIKVAIQQIETALEGLVTGLTFAGGWDATTAEPAAPANNSFYIVDTAGTTSVTTVNLGAKNDWQIGDWLLRDNAANWHAIDNTDLVNSVQSGSTGSPLTGTVVIPDASATVMGVVEYAIDAEAQAGTSTTRAITPANLKSVVDQDQGTYGDGAATTFVLTHNLGSVHVQFTIQVEATGEEVHPAVTAKATNTVTVNHSIAPALDEFRWIAKRINMI